MARSLHFASIFATGLFAFASIGSPSSAQTLVVDKFSTDDPVNIREDGEFGEDGIIDRSIGRVFGGDVDQSTMFRQNQQGDVTTTFQPKPKPSNNYQYDATAIGNAVDAEVIGSQLTKGKQRIKGNVKARLQTRIESSKPAMEVKLNAAAFGNSVSLDNTGTQIVDIRQTNNGASVAAIVEGDIATDSDRTIESNAVALSNNFSSNGPISNFGGDINQRSDANVTAFNRTRGARSTDTVRSTAVGNSISVSRK